MYHDLGLRFLSPTINLYFAHHSFIDYITNLERYTKEGYLEEAPEKEPVNNAPIAYLKCDGLPDVKIHFLHFKSYEEAKYKWEERAKRINFDNIFLVIEAKDDHEHELIDEYLSLPYRKIIFTNLPSQGEEVLHLSCYDKNIGSTSFTNIKGNRGYDDYDFVSKIFKAKRK